MKIFAVVEHIPFEGDYVLRVYGNRQAAVEHRAMCWEDDWDNIQIKKFKVLDKFDGIV